MKTILSLLAFICICKEINAQSVKQIADNINITKPINKGFWLEKTDESVSKTDNKSTTRILNRCFGLVPPRKELFQIQLVSPVKLADYAKTLGVICRQELKLDKITPIPFRFRLGSLEYVNWMERKPNAVYNR